MPGPCRRRHCEDVGVDRADVLCAEIRDDMFRAYLRIFHQVFGNERHPMRREDLD